MSVVMCLSFVACAGETDANSGTESSSTGSQQQQTENTDYVTAIHFKINPEFEIRLDAGNIVVAVECMNEDAKTV